MREYISIVSTAVSPSPHRPLPSSLSPSLYLSLSLLSEAACVPWHSSTAENEIFSRGFVSNVQTEIPAKKTAQIFFLSLLLSSPLQRLYDRFGPLLDGRRLKVDPEIQSDPSFSSGPHTHCTTDLFPHPPATYIHLYHHAPFHGGCDCDPVATRLRGRPVHRVLCKIYIPPAQTRKYRTLIYRHLLI